MERVGECIANIWEVLVSVESDDLGLLAVDNKTSLVVILNLAKSQAIVHNVDLLAI